MTHKDIIARLTDYAMEYELNAADALDWLGVDNSEGEADRCDCCGAYIGDQELIFEFGNECVCKECAEKAIPETAENLAEKRDTTDYAWEEYIDTETHYRLEKMWGLL